MPNDHSFAAVDLGSNSFHMLIARSIDGHLQVEDKLRERVQLGAGLDENLQLSDEAQKRATECLSRFGQRLRGIPPQHVRAVGTQTLRQAKNSVAFLRLAQGALGHSIEVLGGREEARLIYLGVAHSVADTPGKRLVIDIGGGSTECILGHQFQTLETESLHMGCVSFSLRFFPDGKLRRDAWDRAEIAARLELQGLARQYCAIGWDSCVGASGTITAVGEILAASGWGSEGITPEGLRKLRDALLDSGKIASVNLPGLSPERASVLPGGVAILTALFATFGLTSMQVASGALREGLLHDLLGRIRHEDVRDRTISNLCERFAIDGRQAARVQSTALRLLVQVADPWNLQGEDPQQLLGWAARLHEVGLMIAHSGYHKHGAYVVAHSDMPGFSQGEQQRLAMLVRTHRRKLHRDMFNDLSPAWSEPVMRLCILMRLATCLNRDRGPEGPPEVLLRLDGDTISLVFAPAWLDDHPLTLADLEQEAGHLKNLGVRLHLR